ncbi:16S rRNA (uracil(1498)-N(3))-methyltransferase [Georgenia sp. 10Sc9-8]|uniref:Ribosomal RNA small subunit methyltransferase E n=1 Tax=Georgenia halotolerans TaxID=3028317 RepID=A0ABT5TZC7_9MICO|nr:16S rRNA (uracil(1498)-N(3))-methyltransferase [Georgenia halotolerans]
MTAAVFHAGPGGLDAVAPGATVTLTGDEARHAATVRRLRSGEAVELVDGAGRRVAGTVQRAAKDELVVAVAEVTDEHPPTVRLVLVQALAKGGRDEQATETATELGVDAVVPWQSERAVSVWSGPKVRRGRERWSAVALAAAKQSRRAFVPAVAEPVGTRALAARCAEVVTAGGAVVVLHEAATTPLHEAALPAPGTLVLAGEHAATAPEVLVVVGPEGGIAPGELDVLASAGAQVARLGPHVLRTSTAGPVAVALLAQRLGRWETAR